MKENDEVIKDSDRLSNCCGAEMYTNYDTCSMCGEHCDVAEDENIVTSTDKVV